MYDIPIYSGDKPYIFISYAHADSEMIMPFIDRLYHDGYRVWYDENIDLGDKWDDTVARSLLRARCVIAFITENFFKSENCLNEIEFARSENITTDIVIMGDVKEPPGFKLNFSRINKLYLRDFKDEDRFFSRIYRSASIKECKSEKSKTEPYVRNAPKKDASSVNSILKNIETFPDSSSESQALYKLDLKEPILRKINVPASAKSTTKETKKVPDTLNASPDVFTTDVFNPVFSPETDFEIKGTDLIRYKGHDKIVVIPRGITCICNTSFLNVEEIEELIIPEGVEYIEPRAFIGCSNLKRIWLPNSLKFIGRVAFWKCESLEYIHFPDNSAIKYEELAFESTKWLDYNRSIDPLVIVNNILIDGKNCKGTVKIPNNVTTISDATFALYTSIDIIYIPSSVKKIGSYAFFECSKLKYAIFENEKSIEEIGEYAFEGTQWLEEKKSSKKFIAINGILIKASQCEGEILIPYNIRKIASWAFDDSSIKEITIPPSVIRIEDMAFGNCPYLKKAKISRKTNVSPIAFPEDLKIEYYD